MSNRSRSRHHSVIGQAIGIIIALIFLAIGHRAEQRGKNPFWAILRAIAIIVVTLGFVVSLAIRSVKEDTNDTTANSSTTSPSISSSSTIPESGASSRERSESASRFTYHNSPVITQTNDFYDVIADSAVYVFPDDTSHVLSYVHRARKLHVIGTAGSWLQIRMKNGTVGFVPATIAHYERAWID